MNEIQKSPEDHIQERFIAPVLRPVLPAIIRSATDYSVADTLLASVRISRKKLAAWMKEEPADMNAIRPAEGMCFLARKTWESANALFNKFDGILKARDETLTESMKLWQLQEAQRVRREEEKKRAEAEAKAEAERARLRAEAEAERKRLEEEAAKERARLEELAQQAKGNKDLEETIRLRTEAKKAEWSIKLDAANRETEVREEARNHHAEEVLVETRMPEETSMNTKKKFKGRVVDMTKFVRAIADGKYSLGLLLPNESALNKLCDAMGGINLPPGVVAEEVTSFSRKAVRP